LRVHKPKIASFLQKKSIFGIIYLTINNKFTGHTIMQLDIGIIVVIFLLTLLGFLKGFWSQIISIAAAACGVVAVYFAKVRVAEYLFGLLTEKYPEIDIDINVVSFITAILIFVFAYFISGIIMEMIKKRLITSFSIKFSDRIFGLITGALKGCIIALAIILVLEISKTYIASFTSKSGYENYNKWLSDSKAYHYGRDTLGKIEQRIPWFSNTTSRLNVNFSSGNNTNDNENSEVWE